MKYLLFSVFIVSVLFSCKNEKKNNDVEKIKQLIGASFSTSLDKNKLEKIDSVEVIRIDSLTEKSLTWVYIDMMEAKVKDAAEWISSYERTVEYEKEGTMTTSHDQKEIDARELRSYRESIVAYTKLCDSLKASYPRANGTEFYGWKVDAKIYYQKGGASKIFNAHCFVDRNDKVKNIDYELEMLL